MKILALMCVRNEADLLAESLEYLIQSGIEVYVMDNGSTDGSLEIARSYVGKGVRHVERFPEDSQCSSMAHEQFVLGDILRRKNELARSEDADWFLNVDADEFRDGPWDGWNLAESLRRVDREGYSAVNFEVFDFQWTDADLSEEKRVTQRMKHYWQRPWWNSAQIKAWKKSLDLEGMVESGGHYVDFPGRKIYPRRFLMRHYPLRSAEMAHRKLMQDRVQRLCHDEVARGWHTHLKTVDQRLLHARPAQEFASVLDSVAELQHLLTKQYLEERVWQERFELKPQYFELNFQLLQAKISDWIQLSVLELKQCYVQILRTLNGQQLNIREGIFPAQQLILKCLLIMASMGQDIDLGRKINALELQLSQGL